MKPVLALLLLAAPALAQLKAVDQGVADRGPLSASHRMMPLDLRVPTGFDRVYEGRNEHGSRVFLRIDGAIIAAFPASVYEPTEQGQIALIPPGTVFHIGDPSIFETPAPTLIRRSPTAIDRRVRPAAAAASSLWTDESYRQARVRLRLRQASAWR